MTFEYQVLFDSNRDGTYTLDLTDYVIGARWTNGIGQPLQQLADESSLQLTLDNTLGFFTPENPDSPFAPFLPNQRVKIQSLDPQYLLDDSGAYLLDDDGNRIINNAVDYTNVLYVGWFTKLRPDWSASERIIKPLGSSLSGLVRSTMEAIGPKALLEGIEVNLGLYTNFTADELIRDVLSTVQFPSSVLGVWRLGDGYYSILGLTTRLTSETAIGDLETGVSVIPYYGDGQTADAYQLIADVVAAELGWFFINREGEAVFWNRHHLALRRTDDYAVITNDSTNAYLPTALDYEYGGQYINSVRVTASPRMSEASATLWTLDAPYTIDANTIKSFDATLRKSNGQFAGAGSVAVGSSTFSSGTAAISVTSKGSVATVTIVNASAAPATLSALTITGAPITTQNEIAVVVEDGTGISQNGRRRLELDFAAVSELAEAESIAHFEYERRSTIRGNMNSLSFYRKANGTADAFLRDWTYGHRIRVSAPELYHDHDYFIIGEEHDLDMTTGMHAATFILEPAWAHTYWILGTDTLGVSTKLAH